MDNKKFEQLIDLIINENEEQARELFHEIVVEKSREIYESIMDEEMMGDMDEGMGGQVGDLMDEINAEEAGGMTEDDEDMGDEEIVDIDSEEMSDEQGGDEVEDAVVRIEDKLDQLMAEFEQIMAGDEEDLADMGDEEGDEEGDADEAGEEDMMEADDEDKDPVEESVMEAITLKKVGGDQYPKFGHMGDNGAQTKSPGLQNSGQAGMDSKPVKFSGQSEAVPSSPKEPTNAYTKGKTQVKDATAWKNAPAQASQDLESAPKAHTGQASGVNTKSPVAESKKIVKKIVR